MHGIPHKSGYTCEDYRHFPDELRCEIIDGAVHDMTAAPSTKHQRVTGQIYHLIRSHLSSGHPCSVHISPIDVVLAADQVVQPDVLVVCERGKVREAAILGAPDVVFEVLSPATEVKDRGRKLEIYESFGVREYHLVHLDPELVERYILTGGACGRPRIYRGEQTFPIDAIRRGGPVRRLSAYQKKNPLLSPSKGEKRGFWPRAKEKLQLPAGAYEQVLFNVRICSVSCGTKLKRSSTTP